MTFKNLLTFHFKWRWIFHFFSPLPSPKSQPLFGWFVKKLMFIRPLWHYFSDSRLYPSRHCSNFTMALGWGGKSRSQLGFPLLRNAVSPLPLKKSSKEWFWGAYVAAAPGSSVNGSSSAGKSELRIVPFRFFTKLRLPEVYVQFLKFWF